ncbi:MAG: alpha-ketoacid dehydrogenase subunit beta [Firmicutes bacterium]|nr:alpha-ketoacid dehydrogenase subunit beta [Bacillota bacterium]
MREALREALAEEMERDPSVFLLGEDIEDPMGGSYKVTLGLSTRFGRLRVRNAPISEAAIVGAGVGAAVTGSRPVVEVMYMDFLEIAMDQLVSQAAKIRYMSGGQVAVPLTVRCQGGPGRAAGPQHSQLLEAWFAHVPGLKVVVPSTPRDGKALLKAAIRDPDPVLFFEPNILYNSRGPVPDPEADEVAPLGKADVKRPGRDVTVVTYGAMVAMALEAAERLAREDGVAAEVIDLRTVSPWDRETVLASFRKTRALVVAHQAVRQGGMGAEIAATVYEEALDEVDVEIARVGARFAPTPFAPELERYVVPGAEEIVAAARETLERAGRLGAAVGR